MSEPTVSGEKEHPDPLGELTLNHLRSLPDGSLTKAEVNLLIDYIERLERRLSTRTGDTDA